MAPLPNAALEERVAVIGAGTIGVSWAAYFLARGYDVNVTDPVRTAVSIRHAVSDLWPTLERVGLAPGASLERLHVVADPSVAVDGAGFVQENGPEDESLKIELFSRLDAAAPTKTVIASSSSGLLMSRIQSRCKHPERCVIGHPFNPPHLMPLVEVVAGEQTGEASIAEAMSFYRQIGKYPIRIRKEMPGHIANRLQAALWREAVHLVDTGVASVADIDAAVAYGPGLRWALMGPSLTFHLAGGDGGMQHFLDHLAGPMQSWWDDLGTPSLTTQIRHKLVEGVIAEAEGRSIADIARERDAFLEELLRLLGR
jgi:3-hydroxyacyl-CoA dehydrogenase